MTPNDIKPGPKRLLIIEDRMPFLANRNIARSVFAALADLAVSSGPESLSSIPSPALLHYDCNELEIASEAPRLLFNSGGIRGGQYQYRHKGRKLRNRKNYPQKAFFRLSLPF